MISSNSSAPNVRPIVDISPESSCYEDLRAEANLHKYVGNNFLNF